MKTLKMMLAIMAVIEIMVGSTIKVDAAVREDVTKARFEKEIYEEWNESYEYFKELKEEGDEDALLVKDMAMDYTEVGINVYHVRMVINMEDGTVIEGHAFYDAVEEEWFSEYYQVGDERLSSEEFDELYPDYPVF